MAHQPSIKPPGARVITPQGKRGVVMNYDRDCLLRKGSDSVFVEIIRSPGDREYPVELHSSADLTVTTDRSNGDN